MSAVSTRQGKVEGEERDGLTVFKGIPFAAPPVGAQRWLPAQKPAAWSGVREARRFGNAAPQNPVMLSTLAAMKIDEPQSEDCLYLNIWTPRPGNARRPVMVWIHGGGFTIGASSQAIYDGSTLARRGDVVVVTINYRLGPLGFLRLVDLSGGKIPSTGNEGMLDQIAALEWVRDNIAEFGGDPGNVTIFGESAGGMSVGALMGMGPARGLFHRAIAQSGACNTAASTERANHTAARVLERLKVRADDPAALRALTPAQLLKGTLLADGVTPDPELGMAYRPLIDGKCLAQLPIAAVAQGSAPAVAVMAGSTLEEWKLFSLIDRSLQQMDKAGLVARMSRRLQELAPAIVDGYEQARARRKDSTAPGDLFNAIETDRFFRIPALRLCETRARTEPRVYNYLFTWKSPAMGGALGSCHALELGFVFGTNHAPGMPQFAGVGAAAEKLAREMQDSWLAFARSGDPSCEALGTWPGYTAGRRATMTFGESSAVKDAPFEDERRAWDKAPDELVGNL